MPVSIPPAVAAELKRDGEAAIREAVIPAHATLAAFLRETYIPNTRTTLAAEALPDGARLLPVQDPRIHHGGSDTRRRSTLSDWPRWTPFRRGWTAVMREVGFAGSRAAFLANLRTDPRFYVTTPQALLDRAAWIAKTFDGKASTWFGRLPRARFAIRPVPADQAPFYTAGRGGRGVYLLNTYDLPSRPLYALTALTLHEFAPGHAFQMPLAEENEGQPEFRRKGYISAYGEGWALYCERLGEEMGMYETPYDRFGMLSYQMWRACRLVVDTGVHAKGWSRDQALAYLRDNTALSEREIGTEVDRYISWPGQSLSYYLGQRAILAAREKAQVALGPRFDIRAFHDAVLQLGRVPLPAVTRSYRSLHSRRRQGPLPSDDLGHPGPTSREPAHVQIRAFAHPDRAALYEIALLTGTPEATRLGCTLTPACIGDIYAVPYAVLEPQLAFVAEDSRGVAGYIVGTADTRTFEAQTRNGLVAQTAEALPRPGRRSQSLERRPAEKLPHSSSLSSPGGCGGQLSGAPAHEPPPAGAGPRPRDAPSWRLA